MLLLAGITAIRADHRLSPFALLYTPNTALYSNPQQSSSPVYVCNLTEVIDVQRVDLKPFCVEVETKEKLLYFAFRTDEEVYGWMEDIYSRSPLMGVSQPTNFVHQVHVGFDPVSGGFTVRASCHCRVS